VRMALRWHAAGMELADALHVARLENADELITFDKRFARVAADVGAEPPVRLLQAKA